MNPVTSLTACALVACLALAGVPAGAQVPSPSSSVTTAQAVDAAWRRAVVAAEAAGHARRAGADERAASALWAAPPALELSHRTDRWQTDAGARESEVGVAVPLWLPGQRAARLAAARADRTAADAAAVAGRHRIAGSVADAAWEVALSRAEANLAGAHVKLLEDLAADVERRVAAGDLARADALAARAELLSARGAQAQAGQRVAAAAARWTALTGLEQAVPISFDLTAEPASPTAEHPALRAAADNVELARRKLDAVRASRRSPPEVVARVRRDEPGRAQPASHSVGVALRLPFGTDDRNEPLTAAAVTELEVAQALHDRTRVELRSELATARAAEAAASAQLEAETSRSALLRERAALLQNAYRAGETPLPDMLRALSAAGQAEAATERQRAALGLARARVRQALGITP